MKSPLVSVCCTTYNLEKYISKTIDSILEQETTFDYEIIIHDDASTDSTQQIIQSYAEKYPAKIRTIFQNQNIYTTHEGGLGFMFNKYILPEARGKYIAICDGDDYWTDPEKLQKQIDFLKGKDDYSACITNVLVVNEITNDEKKYYSNLETGQVPEWKIIISGGAVYSASTLVFDKEKFTSSIFYKYYNEFSKYHEYDTLFIYCLLLEGKIGYLKDCTAIYRRWEGGLFSGIMHDPYKTSVIKEREIKGNKKLMKLLDRNRKKLFKRKVSVDSLYVLRNKPGIKKLRYLLNLNAKEVFKYLTNYQSTG